MWVWECVCESVSVCVSVYACVCVSVKQDVYIFTSHFQLVHRIMGCTEPSLLRVYLFNIIKFWLLVSMNKYQLTKSHWIARSETIVSFENATDHHSFHYSGLQAASLPLTISQCMPLFSACNLLLQSIIAVTILHHLTVTETQYTCVSSLWITSTTYQCSVRHIYVDPKATVNDTETPTSTATYAGAASTRSHHQCHTATVKQR